MSSTRHAGDDFAGARFDIDAFLNSPKDSNVRQYAPGETIYGQGEAAGDVLYLQSGSVKMSTVAKTGREAVTAILVPGSFFGEAALTGQRFRVGGATALAPSAVLRVDKARMAQLLHQQPAMADRFISHMLTRNIRIEEDLTDQLFNSSEKRLARVLLLLAHYGTLETPTSVVPKISQETLAEIVGTTRSRVNFFLNKFRTLGFIGYSDDTPITVNPSLLTVILND